MKTCKNCGANVSGSFCPNCGTKYEEMAANFCQKCGGKIAAGGMYCSSCGAPTKVESNDSKKEYKTEVIGSNEQNKTLLYFLNWGLLAVILVLFIWFPIMNVSEDSKETLSYYIGDLVGGIEEEYTLFDMIGMMTGNFIDVNEWNEIMNNAILSDTVANLGVINGVLTVVLVFTYLCVGLCVVTLIAYINALINSYKENMSQIKSGEAFSISVLALCFMSFMMLLVTNNFFEMLDIEYAISPYLIGIVVLIVVKWKVLIPMYNRACDK